MCDEAPDMERALRRDQTVFGNWPRIIIQPYWQKLYCHMSKKLKNYGMHQTYEIDLQNVWLDA